MGVWGAVIQGALSVDSSIQEGIAAKKQADANTAMANEAASDALARGARDAGALRMAGSQVAARQMVAFANSGVDATVGTAANVQAGTKANAELEALTTENNAAREAFGYKKHGLDFQAQAGINASRTNREIAGTILGTAGTVGTTWARGAAKKKGSEG